MSPGCFVTPHHTCEPVCALTFAISMPTTSTASVDCLTMESLPIAEPPGRLLHFERRHRPIPLIATGFQASRFFFHEPPREWSDSAPEFRRLAHRVHL